MKIYSFIFSGDLALRDLCLLQETTPNGVMFSLDQNAYASAVYTWSNNPPFAWRTFTEESLDVVARRNVFVILFDSVDIAQARCVDSALWKLPYYIGAMDVSDRSPINVALYEMSLIKVYRLKGRGLDVLVDKNLEGEPSQRDVREIRSFGFFPVRIKNFNWELEAVEFVPKLLKIAFPHR